MSKSSQRLFFVAVGVLVLSFVVAGCTTPPSTSINLNNAQQTNSAPAATPLDDNDLDTTPTSTTSSPVLGKSSSMKQLADFSPIEGKTVTMTTTKGDVVFELFRDKAPLTTLNFLTLAKDGFYDGLVFHRVIADFMAQVGDPLTRDASKQALWGTGDAGYEIADQFSAELKHDSEGIVSMANSGPNTGSSQIFITYAATPWLDGKHAVFGKVTSGMDVLKQITVGDTIVKVTFK